MKLSMKTPSGPIEILSRTWRKFERVHGDATVVRTTALPIDFCVVLGKFSSEIDGVFSFFQLNGHR